MIRLYVEAALSDGADVAPTPDQARYLTTVMRLSLGDELLVFNGRDGEWKARLAQVSKKACRLTLVERTRPQTWPRDVDLIVALVKRGRLETIVEKASELGAARVRLVTTRRTNADHTNLARLSAIAAEAAEQTGRLDVPQVLAPEKLERLIAGWEAARKIVFCDEAGDAPPLADALARAGEGDKPWAVLIGPEGGFSPEERAQLRALPQTVPASLGPRILRADTAAIAALTLWQSMLGDWRP